MLYLKIISVCYTYNIKMLQETKETGVIYCITNEKNNKKYIGQAVSYKYDHGKVKKHGHLGRYKIHIDEALKGSDSCPYLYAAIRKYGETNFKTELLLVCLLDVLDDKESEKILEYKTQDHKLGYNIVLGKSFKKKHDSRMSRIDRISSTMKDKWTDDKEYIEKTTKANFEAVMKRANEGKTRKNNIELKLPPNIYKTDKGYDIRVMRNRKYKITSVEGNGRTDEELLQLAIEKRNKILHNIENDIEEEKIEKKIRSRWKRITSKH